MKKQLEKKTENVEQIPMDSFIKGLPLWIPDGVQDFARSLVKKVNLGKVPSEMLERLERLIFGSKNFKDIERLQKMWKRIENAAVKIVQSKDQCWSKEMQKDEVNNLVFMYLHHAINADGIYRKHDLRMDDRKIKMNEYKKLADFIKQLNELIKDNEAIESPSKRLQLGRGLIEDLSLVNDDIPKEIQVEIMNAQNEACYLFPIIKNLSLYLERIAYILEIASNAVQIPTKTIPFKKKAKNNLLTHYISILKNFVDSNFDAPLHSEIALTAELVFNHAFDVSDDMVRLTTKRDISKSVRLFEES